VRGGDLPWPGVLFLTAYHKPPGCGVAFRRLQIAKIFSPVYHRVYRNILWKVQVIIYTSYPSRCASFDTIVRSCTSTGVYLYDGPFVSPAERAGWLTGTIVAYTFQHICITTPGKIDYEGGINNRDLYLIFV